MLFKYPLHLKFKLFTLTPQVSVKDSSGTEILYVRQKLFALKEEVKVYSDSSQAKQLFVINANKIIDFGAEYAITDSSSNKIIGLIKQQGLKTIWRATYLLRDTTGADKYKITEANPWVKVLDGLVSQIPIVSIFTGYMFHPKYFVHTINGGTHVVTLAKQPSFFEIAFDIELIERDMSSEDEALITTGLMMMVLLQKGRG